MNEKQAREIVEKFNPCDNEGDDSDLIYAKGYLLAIKQMRPLVEAFNNVLSMGALDGVKDSRLDFAHKALAKWNEGQK